MQHADLAQGRWFTLTLAEQLGNVGSEFERVWSWKQRKRQDKFEAAFGRFLELLDLTIADPRWQGPRRRELMRVREESATLLENPQAHDPSSLQKYFFQFALLSRANR